MPDKSKVLIVDDSRSFRSALEQVLADYDDITVVGSVFSGQRALEFIRNSPPDLVTLDVAMPGMDGLETLRAIQQFNASRPDSPPIGVIMVSVSTTEGSRVTVEALQLGAFDYVAKPTGDSLQANIEGLAQQLVGKVRGWRGASHTCRQEDPVSLPVKKPASPRSKSYRAVVIAVSTGGPQALSLLLPALCERIELPIFVVQHMLPDLPEMITTLARNLGTHCSHTVIEAGDGGMVQPRTVYFAPGGKQLVLRHGPAGQVITTLTEQPSENGFRPSADILFRSAAHVWGGDVIALVLTGMLDDGTRGLGPLKRAGAHVIAQDKATSVVWGMPRSAVAAGLVDEVLPLDRIAQAVAAAVQAGRRA
jgi:two-component system chemotaxis response regulator CheB